MSRGLVKRHITGPHLQGFSFSQTGGRPEKFAFPASLPTALVYSLLLPLKIKYIFPASLISLTLGDSMYSVYVDIGLKLLPDYYANYLIVLDSDFLFYNMELK